MVDEPQCELRKCVDFKRNKVVWGVVRDYYEMHDEFNRMSDKYLIQETLRKLLMLRKLINQMIYDICCPRCANDQKAKI